LYHGATRALPAEKIAPVKWVAVTEIWYNASELDAGCQVQPLDVENLKTLADQKLGFSGVISSR